MSLVTFMHAADLHLDSPMRGLGGHEGAPVERLRGATRVAFTQLVDLAISRKIDLLVLAGDIYDGDWQDFNTGLFFRKQLVRLREADIRVFMIHGNHDAQSIISRALPGVEGVTVFSAERCQSEIVESLGIAVHGQSYAQRIVDTDLAAQYPQAIPGAFNIGMLHTSLTGREGHENYAPTTLEVLRSKGYEYFALGHVHTREIVQEADPRIVFPGNLQGRNVREPGAHGCDLVTVEDGQIVSTEFMELDVLRWHRLSVDITGVETLDVLSQLISTELRSAVADATEHLHAMRVSLTGESALRVVEAEQPGTLRATIEAVVQDIVDAEIWLEKTPLQLRAPVLRDALLEQTDALGEVVRLVNTLRNDDDALREWFQAQTREMTSLPHTLAHEDPTHINLDQMRVMLMEAESTVLANLVEPGTDDKHR